jgi:homogentisate 1,2-dioxygenase
VLSAVSNAHPGTAVADFVIFPPRWLIAEDTFRRPSYHRNVMSEFIGLIHGSYIAKEGGKGGFQPAGTSLHNVMSSHGPDAFEKATNEVLAPVEVVTGSMTFMFESCFMVGVTEWGLKTCCKVQDGYSEESWGWLMDRFEPPLGLEEKRKVLNGDGKAGH